MVGRGPRGSIGTNGSFGSGSSGRSSFGGRSAGMNGPQYTQGNFHHQGQPPGQWNIFSHQHPSVLPSFGTCPSMWSSIWPMALGGKVFEQPRKWLLPALCPSSDITRPTLHPREGCVALEIPYSYLPFHASPGIDSHMTSM